MGIRILVTGGAGYLGSILVPGLLARGHRVTVVDSLRYGQSTLLECCADPGFDFIRGDICDKCLMAGLLGRFDAVIPLAAIVGAPACQAWPETARMVNLDAHMNIVNSVSPSQIVIFPTTNSGYGIGEPGGYCTEESPLRPVSEYARMKMEVEKAFLDRGNAVTYRLATVFGMSPRMRLDLLVNDFVFRAWRDRYLILFEEHFRRNFIHIRDAAGAFIFAIDNYDRMKGEPYNAGLSSANLSKRQLCEKIREHLPGFIFQSSPVGEDPDRRDYLVSNEKLESLGWRPEHTLDMGIQELLKGFPLLRDNCYGNCRCDA